MNLTKRQEYELLRSQLKNERASFIPHWRDISDFLMPRRMRVSMTDNNRGDKKNKNIIDCSGTLALRTLRSGMMSGVTSPARPWFRLTTPDPDLAEFGPVKEWLHTVTTRMSNVFLKSNLYNVLPICYGDIGGFGTSALMVEEDFDDVVRYYPFPLGSYSIANNPRLKVDVFTREYQLTVRQLIKKFAWDRNTNTIDWSKVSLTVKNLWNRGESEVWIDICHVILPNEDYNPNRGLSQFKKFVSCNYELGYMSGASTGYMSKGDEDRYLRESGYDYFPVLCPRWETSGEDVYGTDCPGMTALGDVRQLQLGEKRSMQAIDKMVNPPLSGPTSLRTQKVSALPGDITYLDAQDSGQGLRPTYEVNPRTAELEAKQEQVRFRISRAFFEDLFLMLSQSDRREITAREIDERHEEKLLALGPVLEQLNQDLLDPNIDIGFAMMERQGLLPPAPPELQGMKLRVEYISVMAQAQKMIGIAGVERLAGFVNQVATILPDAYDKIDVDQMIDVYGDMVSVPPSIIRSDEDVAAIRDQRAKAAQAQQMAMAAKESSVAAKNLSQTDMGGDNALTRMIQQGEAGQLVQAS